MACLMLVLSMGCWAAKAKSTAVVERNVQGVNVRVQFLSDHIVRVLKYKGEAGAPAPEKKSYSVIMEPQADVDLTISQEPGGPRIASGSLVVLLNEQTG